MTSIEFFRRRIIDNLDRSSYYENGKLKVYGVEVGDINSMEEFSDYFTNKTDQELLDFCRNIDFYNSNTGMYRKELLSDMLLLDQKLSFVDVKKELLSDMLLLDQKLSFVDVKKEIAVIKDSVQNTADVINLFTDIDKNRTNLEEQNKEINKRLDKLEESISQILELLQKS